MVLDNEKIETMAKNIVLNDLTLVSLNERAIAYKYYILGVQAAMKLPWHEASEIPEEYDKSILIEYNDWGVGIDYVIIRCEEYNVFLSRPYSDLYRWLYIDDLFYS